MAQTDHQDRSLLDPETLRRVLRQLESTDVDELEVTVGSSRLFVRREPGKRVSVIGEQVEREPAPPGVAVVAPLTGVFYSRPTPEQPPFVRPGDPVEAGQVVGLIETMKLFNEVTAELAGEVVSVAARDGELVETGQPLMHVRPRQEGGHQ